jgi:6-pyruvoyltetrahydropterin/6-carboxytetrahydropterin synthase
MLLLTKIFRFEMAHAIHGYDGDCKNIHGHSYELHVTITSKVNYNNYIPGTGFFIDFKNIKKIVGDAVVIKFDHKLVLSNKFLAEHPSFNSQSNLVVMDVEPSAENLLLNICQMLKEVLPVDVKLIRLKLFETKDSYAEWISEEVKN